MGNTIGDNVSGELKSKMLDVARAAHQHNMKYESCDEYVEREVLPSLEKQYGEAMAELMIRIQELESDNQALEEQIYDLQEKLEQDPKESISEDTGALQSRITQLERVEYYLTTRVRMLEKLTGMPAVYYDPRHYQNQRREVLSRRPVARTSAFVKDENDILHRKVYK